MGIQPKYRVIRIIEKMRAERLRLDLKRNAVRKKDKKMALIAAIDTMDWCIEALRAEIR